MGIDGMLAITVVLITHGRLGENGKDLDLHLSDPSPSSILGVKSCSICLGVKALIADAWGGQASLIPSYTSGLAVEEGNVD